MSRGLAAYRKGDRAVALRLWRFVMHSMQAAHERNMYKNAMLLRDLLDISVAQRTSPHQQHWVRPSVHLLFTAQTDCHQSGVAQPLRSRKQAHAHVSERNATGARAMRWHLCLRCCVD